MLKQEFAALLAERKRQYIGYDEAKENMRQLVMAKGNVQRILGIDTSAPQMETREANRARRSR